jgi:hypothetical protein
VVHTNTDTTGRNGTNKIMTAVTSTPIEYWEGLLKIRTENVVTEEAKLARMRAEMIEAEKHVFVLRTGLGVGAEFELPSGRSAIVVEIGCSFGIHAMYSIVNNNGTHGKMKLRLKDTADAHIQLRSDKID